MGVGVWDLGRNWGKGEEGRKRKGKEPRFGELVFWGIKPNFPQERGFLPIWANLGPKIGVPWVLVTLIPLVNLRKVGDFLGNPRN